MANDTSRVESRARSTLRSSDAAKVHLLLFMLTRMSGLAGPTLQGGAPSKPNHRAR